MNDINDINLLNKAVGDGKDKHNALDIWNFQDNNYVKLR